MNSNRTIDPLETCQTRGRRGCNPIRLKFNSLVINNNAVCRHLSRPAWRHLSDTSLPRFHVINNPLPCADLRVCRDLTNIYLNKTQLLFSNTLDRSTSLSDLGWGQALSLGKTLILMEQQAQGGTVSL